MYYYILGNKTGDGDYEEIYTMLNEKKYSEEDFQKIIEICWDNENKLARRELSWQEAICNIRVDLCMQYEFFDYELPLKGAIYKAFPKATKP